MPGIASRRALRLGFTSSLSILVAIALCVTGLYYASQHEPFLPPTDFLDAWDCTPYGWNYNLSLPTYDARAKDWLRNRQRQMAKLCGYGVDEALPASTARYGEILIDVGANVGLSLLPYASRGWTVYAFEPIAINAKIIRVNIERNRFENVHLFQWAASNWTGSTKVFVPAGREDNAAMAGAAVAEMNVETKSVRVEVVNVTTVDRALFAIRTFQPDKVKLIKIDTQGHEIEVLSGMKRLLASIRDDTAVVAEYNEQLQRSAGHSGRELLSLARSSGFDVYCGAECIPGNSANCPDITLRKKAWRGNKPCRPNNQNYLFLVFLLMASVSLLLSLTYCCVIHRAIIVRCCVARPVHLFHT